MELDRILSILSKTLKSDFVDTEGELVFMKEVTDDFWFPNFKVFNYGIAYENSKQDKHVMCSVFFKGHVPPDIPSVEKDYDSRLQEYLLESLFIVLQNKLYIESHLKGIVFKSSNCILKNKEF